MNKTETEREPEYFTVEEIAERLRVTQLTVRRWIGTGHLEAIKAGRAFRIHRDDLAAMLQARKASALSDRPEGLWDPDRKS